MKKKKRCKLPECRRVIRKDSPNHLKRFCCDPHGTLFRVRAHRQRQRRAREPQVVVIPPELEDRIIKSDPELQRYAQAIETWTAQEVGMANEELRMMVEELRQEGGDSR